MARQTRGEHMVSGQGPAAPRRRSAASGRRSAGQSPRRTPARRPAGRRPASRRDRRGHGLLLRLGTVGAVGILALAVRRIAGCRLGLLGLGGPVESVTSGIDAGQLYRSPYDWGNLVQGTDGRYTYVSGGRTLSRAGIDVSEHQGYIDWSRVRDDGIDFAFVRVGYRGSGNASIVRDSYAEYNLQAAQDAGLDIGVYFYSQATTADEAVEEAEFVLDQIGDAQLTYPVVFDFEPANDSSDRISSLTGTQRTEVALAFCRRIEQAGHAAMVYGNGPQLDGYDLEQLAPYGFWYAEYGSAPSTDLFFGIWQYSNTGTVAGVDTDVDLDLDLTPVFAQSEAN